MYNFINNIGNFMSKNTSLKSSKYPCKATKIANSITSFKEISSKIATPRILLSPKLQAKADKIRVIQQSDSVTPLKRMTELSTTASIFNHNFSNKRVYIDSDIDLNALKDSNINTTQKNVNIATNSNNIISNNNIIPDTLSEAEIVQILKEKVKDFKDKELKINKLLLGFGSYGGVYELTTEPSTNENYVLKINNNIENCSGEYLYFSKKIQQSNNLATTYYCSNDSKYILMKYYNGPNIYNMLYNRQNLDNKFKNKQINEEEFISDILKAMNILKLNNFLHNDLKPGNVIFNINDAENSQNFVLCDFGALTNNNITMFKNVVGTYTYMSPERRVDCIRKRSIIDEKSDIWSLGISILEIIANNNFCFDLFKKFYNNNKNFIEQYVKKDNVNDSFFVELQNIVDEAINEICNRKIEKKEEYKNLLKNMLKVLPDSRFDIKQCMDYCEKDIYTQKNINKINGLNTYSMSI